MGYSCPRLMVPVQAAVTEYSVRARRCAKHCPGSFTSAHFLGRWRLSFSQFAAKEDEFQREGHLLGSHGKGGLAGI